MGVLSALRLQVYDLIRSGSAVLCWVGVVRERGTLRLTALAETGRPLLNRQMFKWSFLSCALPRYEPVPGVLQKLDAVGLLRRREPERSRLQLLDGAAQTERHDDDGAHVSVVRRPSSGAETS